MMEYIDIAIRVVTVIIMALTFWQSRKNGHVAKVIVREVSDIKEQTNGLNAKLIEVTGEAKYAEGVKHGEKYAERTGQ